MVSSGYDLGLCRGRSTPFTGVGHKQALAECMADWCNVLREMDNIRSQRYYEHPRSKNRPNITVILEYRIVLYDWPHLKNTLPKITY